MKKDEYKSEMAEPGGKTAKKRYRAFSVCSFEELLVSLSMTERLKDLQMFPLVVRLAYIAHNTY